MDAVHHHYMSVALEEAYKAAEHADVPVGCVIVKDGKIIGRGHNRREADHNAVAHAEVMAIQEACNTLGSWRLLDADLYVTLEPCPMCAGGILNARVRALYYGAKEERMGCCGSILNLFEERFHHHPRIYGGIMEDECRHVLQEFFKQQRIAQNSALDADLRRCKDVL